MSVVRIEALRALAALIELQIPELSGAICVGVAPSSEHEHIPNLSIQPSRWKYDPEQAEQAAALPGNVVVWNVGEHSCAMVLSIVHSTPAQRWTLEAKVIDLFLASVHPLTGHHRPGVLVVPVTACPELSDWFAAFELESDEWSDGLAQDRRYESRITINGIVPALTIERGVYTVDQLLLAVTEDLTTAFTPATAIPPAVDLVIINEDGSISRYEP